MVVKARSFRVQLKGSLSDFLKDENMQCSHTEEGLLELVVSLSHYTEEGSLLFPQVLICDDLNTSLKLIQGTDSLQLGIEQRNSCNVAQILKRCAPLSQGGWITYIHRNNNIFPYGVFRASHTPTALDVRGTIASLSEEKVEVPCMILVSWLAEKAVELVGSRSGCVHIYLSARPEDHPSPRDALELLANAVCSDVPVDFKEQTANFSRATLFDAMRRCHGTLVAVGHKEQIIIPDLTEDGVLLQSPIDLAELVRQHKIQNSNETLAALMAYTQLLVGMLSSDGIIILDTAYRLLGYNFFVKKSNAQTPGKVVGGARRRAYVELCKMVDEDKLHACFIQSSDGSSEFYKG